MQPTKQQRVFLVTAWLRSDQVVQEEFSKSSPERNVIGIAKKVLRGCKVN